MPVVFIGHGSPMNAIEDNEFSRGWEEVSQRLPMPKAILCISAHWETRGTWVTAMPKPRTIYDFYGFPRALYEVTYPALGSPKLADRIGQLIQSPHVEADQQWGLDHGTWSVLVRMYPQANIPVIQMSLDRTRDLPFHYELGKQLLALRSEGVLLVGSGNIVHNLRMMVWEDRAFDWAIDYDTQIKQWVMEDDHQSIIHYERFGRAAELSVNSAEHYLPLLYILGVKQPGEEVRFFNEIIWGGSLSMRCIQVG